MKFTGKMRSSFLKNKKGIQLSVNFLVIIIISLVVLGMGFTFLFKLFDQANQGKEDLDDRTEQALLRLLIDEGKRVALPLHIANLYGGDSHTFGIGVLNVALSGDEFWLHIELDSATNVNNEAINTDTSEWVLYQGVSAIGIKEAEHRIEPIRVDVPGNAPKGKYIFNAQVYEDAEKTIQYGNTQKFIVNVN
jgi:hypothetical protein